jgi:hypothetical protein
MWDEVIKYPVFPPNESAVRDGTPLLPTTEQARHVVEIIEKAYLAASTGVVQPLTTRFV